MFLSTPLRFFLAGTLAWWATSIHAEVKQSAPDSLLLAYSHRIAATPATVYDAIGQIERWWSGDHTYSGDATRLTLRLDAGSCFCERWRDGSVLHARVVLAQRDQLVRLDGAFGPLQAKAVTAVLSIALKAEERATALDVTYRVNGAPASALDKDAGSVDRVLAEQFLRLKRYVETGKATE